MIRYSCPRDNPVIALLVPIPQMSKTLLVSLTLSWNPPINGAEIMARIKGRLAMIPASSAEKPRFSRYITMNVNSTAHAGLNANENRPR